MKNSADEKKRALQLKRARLEKQALQANCAFALQSRRNVRLQLMRELDGIISINRFSELES